MIMQNVRAGDPGQTPIALGGRRVPVRFDSTSAHAEYEGLLLGLEWLCEQRKDLLNIVSSDGSPETRGVIVIQGDCKTVIDQLSGKSFSRKLQVPHQQALDHIEELKHTWDFRYEHIPREYNTVCDDICARITNLLTWKVSNDMSHYLNDLAGNRSSRDASPKSTVLVDILAQYFDPRTSLVRYSERPAFYYNVATLAAKMRDYEAMLQLGELMAAEAKFWTTHSNLKLAHGIKYQIEGFRGMGQEKKATQLERKYRVLLQKSGGGSAEFYGYKERLVSQDAGFVGQTHRSSLPSEWEPLVAHWMGHALQSSWMETSTVWVDSFSAKE